MERVPCKCKIDFEIAQKPCLPITNKAFSETEGRLFISVGENIIFDEEDILLAELYSALKSWISRGSSEDFKYDSMDYEDFPILEFRVKDVFISISSVWMDKNLSVPVAIGKQEFIDAVKLFVCRFESELPEIKAVY
jgi:hypothetical protein